MEHFSKSVWQIHVYQSLTVIRIWTGKKGGGKEAKPLFRCELLTAYFDRPDELGERD